LFLYLSLVTIPENLYPSDLLAVGTKCARTGKAVYETKIEAPVAMCTPVRKEMERTNYVPFNSASA